MAEECRRHEGGKASGEMIENRASRDAALGAVSRSRDMAEACRRHEGGEASGESSGL